MNKKIDNNKRGVILFIDDIHLANKDVKKFVGLARTKLGKKFKIIMTSREDIKVRYNLNIKGILAKEEYHEFVKELAKEYSKDIKEEEKELFYEISKGHPLLTEILVRYVLGVIPLKYEKDESERKQTIERIRNEINENIIKQYIKEEDYIKEFFKRLIEEIFEDDEEELKKLCMLSVYRRPINLEMAKVLDINITVLSKFVDKYMLKLNKDSGRYVFYDDVVKECIKILLDEKFEKSAKIEAHRKAAEYYKEYYEKYLEGEKKFVEYCVEYLYHLVESQEFIEVSKILCDEESWRAIIENSNVRDILQIIEKTIKNISDLERIIILKTLKSEMYRYLNEIDKSIEILEECLMWCENNYPHSDVVKARAYHKLVYPLIFRNDYINALKYSKLALNIAKELNDEKFLRNCYYRHGTLYLYLSNFKGAIKQYNEASNHGREDFKTLRDVGDSLTRMGDLKEAYSYFIESYEKSSDIKNKTYEGLCLLGFSFILSLLGDTNKSEKYLEDVKNLSQEYSSIYDLMKVLHYIGILNHILKNF